MTATLSGTSGFSILTTLDVSEGGIGQDALASNMFVEAGMALDHEVSFLVWRVVTVGAASGCCSWGLLKLGVEGPSPSWKLGVGLGIPLTLLWDRLYTVTGIDMAPDLVTGVWVVAVEVVTVAVGSACGIGFTGKVWLVGIFWAITLTLNLLLTGALVLLFFSTFLGVGAFLGKEFVLGEDILVYGWLPLHSSSKYVLIFLIRDG